jgi:valyl-tRNA synthetase
MEAKYDPKSVEPKLRKFWESEDIYKFDPRSPKRVFSVDTPPPTVSGEMHMGHAFSYSQQDFVVRYRRMAGFNVFYPFGTDDNGLPTARLVEKKRNMKEKDVPRAEFVKLCMEFLDDELPGFVQDWKNLGVSCDFTNYYSTIDDRSRRIAQWSFLDLYEKGRIYRKDAPAMWCPECKTGIAQIELKDKEIDSTLNEVAFKVAGEEVIIATTRPELLMACVAMFYSPGDARYTKYKDKKATVPLFGFEVPIKEDERVKPEFGTGLVMCCTFGDQTDMEWQKAYDLPIKMALSQTGEITEIGGKYQGLRIKQARKAILEDLKAGGLLKSQKQIKHMVNTHERCGTEIEFIKSKQWFVRYLDLKDKMLEWGNKINWHPEYMHHRYDNWVKGLQWDWLISQQRYFGVPFPLWYCGKCGEPILADQSQLPVDPQAHKPKSACRKCGSTEFIPEVDVLNTWFTSSLTPKIASDLMPEASKKELFPMSLRPQAHDIITFWLFTTVLKSNLHFGKNPWKDAIISGFVTLKGEKMSKSKGNIIRPQEIVEKYGADPVRYWCSCSKLGDDLEYNEKDLVTGSRVVNKLWNVARFVSANPEANADAPINTMDRWIISKAMVAMKEAADEFDHYDYAAAKRRTEEIFWSFCDNYMEFIKYRIYGKDASANRTLNVVFNSILKMFAPFLPYVTEEIYQELYAKAEGKKSIHISDWPKLDSTLMDKASLEEGDEVTKLIVFIRSWKHDNKMALNAELSSMKLEGYEGKALEDIKGAMKIKEIVTGKGTIQVPETKMKISITV